MSANDKLQAFRDTLRSRRKRRDDPEKRERRQRLSAPLPWPRSTAEVMIDSMSVIDHAFFVQQLKRQDILFQNDRFHVWPGRVFMAAKALNRLYGKECPPSPWRPVIAVYDQPDPRETPSGLKVRTWSNLYKQGPREAGRVTLGWAQTYVDQSAEERWDCDREILYMLELLTRDFPRRQVLVTDNPWLEQQASRFATVRSPKWLMKELKEAGQEGKAAIEALTGESKGDFKTFNMLPRCVRKAFSSH